MKKLALSFAAVAALALPSIATAQTAQGAVSATATISTILDFGTPTDMAFGTILPGAAGPVRAQGSIPLVRNVGVKIFLPDGATTGVLSGPTGSTAITPTLTCGVNSTTTPGGTAAVPTYDVSTFSSCRPATPATEVATLVAPTTAAAQTMFVIFNGTITGVPQTQVPGTYTGVINVRAVAN
ncbi:MAG TPA: hypothetical protein VF625_02710 [Longimicrobium sp.]|jgi:hypothetical protein